MIRKGYNFKRASMVIMLPPYVNRKIEEAEGDVTTSADVRFGQIVSPKKWKRGDALPKGAFMMEFGATGNWGEEHYDERTPIIWPVVIIPSMGHSRTNMMYGIGRVFWAEDGCCYSTCADKINEPELHKLAREIARKVASKLEDDREEATKKIIKFFYSFAPKKCVICRQAKENVSCTAYLPNRQTLEGLCPECREMAEREAVDTLTAECMEKFCNFVNAGSWKDLGDSMVRTIQRQHRYLQNEFFLALLRMFAEYGKLPENCFDARNEWAVQISKKWTEAASVL